jgi:hypothetical protein
MTAKFAIELSLSVPYTMIILVFVIAGATEQKKSASLLQTKIIPLPKHWLAITPVRGDVKALQFGVWFLVFRGINREFIWLFQSCPAIMSL